MLYAEFIKQSLAEAADIARAKFGKVAHLVKSGDNNQVLTEADVAIGQMLIARIEIEFPDHNIIDEEAGVIDRGSRYTWVIDPIDGTSNFAVGLPHYGVMIGLLDEATPIAGGAALPSFNEIYVAEKGQGAWCDDKPIHATDEMDLLNTLVAYGIDGHQEQPDLTRQEIKLLGEIVLDIRNLRTSNSVYDIMQVANGKYGAYLNRTSKIWDNVAPQIIIEEAGGVYTDFWGKSIDYSTPTKRAEQNFTCCTAAPALHRQLQQIIESA
jgi:myo-inositol-1(or 4)-monophosphatase